MSNLEIHFLDVGQGDGTFIIFPDGITTMLVDLGSKKNAHIAGQDAIQFISNRLASIAEKNRIKPTIDYMFITHGDDDHYNLLPSLVEQVDNLEVKNFFLGGTANDYHQSIIQKVPAKQEFFSKQEFDKEGQARWKISGVNVYLLAVNNPKAMNSTAKNSSSIVLMLDYKGNKVMLMGDAERNVEAQILNRGYSRDFLNSVALKLGHHGSKNATTSDWIDAVQPQAIFASADERWSHPYKDVIDRFKVDTSVDVLANNLALAEVYSHSIVCGTTRHEEYINPTLTSAVFTNIYKMEVNRADNSKVAYGTQYCLCISDSNTFSVSDPDHLSDWIKTN